MLESKMTSNVCLGNYYGGCRVHQVKEQGNTHTHTEWAFPDCRKVFAVGSKSLFGLAKWAISQHTVY